MLAVYSNTSALLERSSEPLFSLLEVDDVPDRVQVLHEKRHQFGVPSGLDITGRVIDSRRA